MRRCKAYSCNAVVTRILERHRSRLNLPRLNNSYKQPHCVTIIAIWCSPVHVGAGAARASFWTIPERRLRRLMLRQREHATGVHSKASNLKRTNNSAPVVFAGDPRDGLMGHLQRSRRSSKPAEPDAIEHTQGLTTTATWSLPFAAHVGAGQKQHGHQFVDNQTSPARMLLPPRSSASWLLGATSGLCVAIRGGPKHACNYVSKRRLRGDFKLQLSAI